MPSSSTSTRIQLGDSHCGVGVVELDGDLRGKVAELGAMDSACSDA